MLPIGCLLHPVGWPTYLVGWLILPVPPYAVEKVCGTGKMGQDLKEIMAELPVLTRTSFPSLSDSSNGLGIGYARGE